MVDAFFGNYAAYEHAVASTQLFLAMLGMGALLTPEDFLLEIKNPKGVVVGLSMQWLLVPLVAVVCGALLPVPAGIAVGMLLVACVPGGTMSNILTLFGRGNIALSISLTSITTVAALVTTPLLLSLLAAQYLPDDFEMPTGRLAREIFFTLVVPLLIGMLVHNRTSTVFAGKFSKWMIRLSLLAIVVMVTGAGGSGRLDADAYGMGGVMALVVFCLSLQVAATLVSKAAGLQPRDSLAVVIEAAFRNVSLAVAVKAVIFPAQAGVLDPIGDAVLFTALLYGGVSMFMCLGPVIFSRRTTAVARDGAELDVP
jgi:BASS family bile acid:Na+ symporter